MIGKLWRRLWDRVVHQRTLAAIAERECQHDGSEPMCNRCAPFYNGV